MNVLHVDDEPELLSIMLPFLEHYGQLHGIRINTTELIDPVQGLFEAVNHGNKYDLIMLDVNMPKLSGGDIYQQIAHSQPHLLGRVLFVTAFRGDLDRRFPNLQLNVLDKPFRYAQLEAVIQSMMPR